ncbi:hypothetical protein, partial [Streptomyces griseorubiginosus]|uniref:hypothetical protein n=1 Tax=Streptomyces griseorubiginosus TaxID=67304 RepID=UPI001AD7D0F2
MSGFGSGIRRGVMAADRYTQIANALFRDGRISYRAKGLFGYISTHRDGWPVTIAALVARGPDGREAVRTGLQELEAHGYLIRERLRRPDGTLGEIVYCITDRPAAWDIARIEAGLASPATEAEYAGNFPAGIRRGVMAADQFTQIANTLFRDTRLSFKAKGLFGLLSTHRDGWRMTVTDIVRRGRDGDAAVKSGLKELQKHGFLVRERQRAPGGTLGAAAYVITDLPAWRSGRSQPESGFPPVDDPTLADPGTKNTTVKNTNQHNTQPFRPCDRGDGARTNASAAPAHAATSPKPPAAGELDAGIRLLLEIGAERPELLLTGPALRDQGRVASVMLEAGWSPGQLRHVVTGRPLPCPVSTSIGAIIAARLRAAQAYPPPATAARHGAAPLDGPSVEAVGERSSTAAAARTVGQALSYRALTECAGCGVPATAGGGDLCPACLG